VDSLSSLRQGCISLHVDTHSAEINRMGSAQSTGKSGEGKEKKSHIKNSAGSLETTPKASEEEMAEVEAASKEILDTPGGKALDIMLSPAVKKPRSRVSAPPTSPPTLASIDHKLKGAEERKKIIETERVRSLENHLAKIDIAQQKKEESENVKAEKINKANEARLHAADEKKAKGLVNIKDKVSEHMSKIERAQKELESSLEAARIAAEVSIAEKMEKSEEKKNLHMEEMLKKIKEHQEHVREVHSNQEEKLKPHVEKVQASIKAKEERAREIRAKKETEQKEKLAEQNKRAEGARLNRAKLHREEVQQDSMSNYTLGI